MLTRRSFLFAGAAWAGSLGPGFPWLDSVVGTRAADRKRGEDETNVLQAALARGGHITLEQNRIYQITGKSGAKAALFIESDTYLDLNGATLMLAPNQRCSLLACRDAGPVRNVRIANGIIDGNGANQPPDFRPDIGITPTLYLMNCDALALRDLTIRDAYMYAVYTQGHNCVIDNLDNDGAIGGGIYVDGEGWHIDKVRVRNVSYWEKVNCQGNPFIVSLRNSSIGSVRCENYGFGIKFQDGCENLTVDSVEAIGGQNNNDYLVKVQGRKDSSQDRPNRNITIARIEARNGPYSGLYLYYSFGVQIGGYLGEANGQASPLDLKKSADVLVIDADGIHFGDLRAFEYPRHALWLHKGSGKVTVDRVVMKSSRSPYTIPVMVRQGRALLAGTEYSGEGRKHL